MPSCLLSPRQAALLNVGVALLVAWLSRPHLHFPSALDPRHPARLPSSSLLLPLLLVFRSPRSAHVLGGCYRACSLPALVQLV